MGCDAHLVVTGGDDPDALLRRAGKRLAGLEAALSRFLPASELSRLNAAAGTGPVRVSARTFDVVAAAVDAWAQTGGRYDPTILPALLRAGYDRTFAELAPDTAPASVARPSPGCAAIGLERTVPTVTLPEGTALDLGGIAKGYAADLLVEELRSAGAGGACVNLGGDVRVGGQSPDRAGWTVAIADPYDQASDLAHLALADGAVATSSRLRRCWATPAGAHHLIDPRTGEPAVTTIAAVTVLASTATRAEAWTKAVFAAGARHRLARGDGPDSIAGLAVLASADLSGLCVDERRTIYHTDDMREYLTWTRNSGGISVELVG